VTTFRIAFLPISILWFYTEAFTGRCLDIIECCPGAFVMQSTIESTEIWLLGDVAPNKCPSPVLRQVAQNRPINPDVAVFRHKRLKIAEGIPRSLFEKYSAQKLTACPPSRK